jgi:hypothetical protein
MEFETNIEQMADQQDAFLDGWDEETYQPESEEQVEETVEEAEETETTEETTEEVAEQTEEATEETTETATETEEKPAPVTEWVIKHMGTEQKITVADITPELLQKGKDYDRIRNKYDESKPIVELVGQFAEKANMTIADYIKALRTEAKKASGMSDAEAQRTIDLEDREAAVTAAEAKQQEAEQEKNATDERVRADLELFGKLYPDIFEQVKRDRTVIPKEVWDEAYNGGSLVVAYKKYADAQAAAEKAQILARVAAAEQGAKNAARSTGSMKSAGNDTKNTDPFLSDWD